MRDYYLYANNAENPCAAHILVARKIPPGIRHSSARPRGTAMNVY